MNTLADLRAAFQLYAVCPDCRRMESVDVVALAERLGADTPIASIRSRLRCRACGRRTHDIRIVYVGEAAKVSGFHYRRPNPARSAQSCRSSVDSSVRPKPSTPT